MSCAFQIHDASSDTWRAPAENPGFEDLLQTACTAIDASVVPIYERFEFRNQDRWDCDYDTGEIWWTTKDGRVADAHFQLAGTWVEATETFKWAWDHPLATEAIRQAADLVRAEGERLGAEVLSENFIHAPDPEPWHLTKITAHLAGLPGVYRAKTNEKARIYIAFSEPKWRQ